MIHSLVNSLSRHWDRHPSLLTVCGAPIERNLTSTPGLRLTLEVASASASPAEKWQTITSSTGLTPALLGPWAHLACQPGQRYGVWLGVRRDLDRLKLKIYQEAHGAFGNELDTWLAPSMIAADDQGGLEFYGRLKQPRAPQLHRWLALLDAQASLPLLLDHLGLFAGLSRERLDNLRLGASVRLENGRLHTPTVFVHTHQVHDDNRASLVAVGRLTQSLKIPLCGLEPLRSGLLADPLRRMGMLGLTLCQDERLLPSLGLAGLSLEQLACTTPG